MLKVQFQFIFSNQYIFATYMIMLCYLVSYVMYFVVTISAPTLHKTGSLCANFDLRICVVLNLEIVQNYNYTNYT